MVSTSFNGSPSDDSVPSDSRSLTSLSLIALFHLNFAFSSIEIDRRPVVMEQCYWPLLRLARELNLPLGIEATGYTLEVAAELDPSWIDELRWLITQGNCEFIGSGYAQVIGPIVPSEVNIANLYWGHQVYEQLLGVRPQIALVNEQAYSASLVSHYLKAGYQAIVMEWNNPAQYHREWDSQWRYFPQYACSQTGEKIPVIWNNSTAFQKFQQYIYADLEWDEYVEDFLVSNHSSMERVFMLYGNDAEIFNFRPGRYLSEAELKSDEWQKIYHLMKALQDDRRFELISLSRSLEYLQSPEGGNSLSLESAEDPIPVKKQRKYNVTRWAVSGTDLEINTQCWALYDRLYQQFDLQDLVWKELCYLWSSDFRTHITPKRFREYQQRLNQLRDRLGIVFSTPVLRTGEANAPIPAEVEVLRQGKFLILETAQTKLRLNCDRGLAIDRLWFKQISSTWLCGSLAHGYYDDIDWLEDHFSGHLVFQAPGESTITDLQTVDPVIWCDRDEKIVWVNAKIETSVGLMDKQVGISIDSPQVHLGYQLDWPKQLSGYLRFGYVMLNPEAFEPKSLYLATHNGGEQLERFSLDEKSFDHHSPVSSTVSSRCGLGVTEGKVILGDRNYQLQIRVNKAESALLGMMSCQPVGSSYFLRLAFSAREQDETAKPNLFEIIDPEKAVSVYRLSITAQSPS